MTIGASPHTGAREMQVRHNTILLTHADRIVAHALMRAAFTIV
jgi:hypothetical protein